MSTKIGGIVVAEGSRLKWGAIGSVIAGSWVYVYTQGLIGLVTGASGFVDDGLGGIRAFAVALIQSMYGGGIDAITASWASFGASVQDLGPFAWPVVVVVVVLSIYAMHKAVVSWL